MIMQYVDQTSSAVSLRLNILQLVVPDINVDNHIAGPSAATGCRECLLLVQTESMNIGPDRTLSTEGAV